MSDSLTHHCSTGYHTFTETACHVVYIIDLAPVFFPFFSSKQDKKLFCLFTCLFLMRDEPQYSLTALLQGMLTFPVSGIFHHEAALSPGPRLKEEEKKVH